MQRFWSPGRMHLQRALVRLLYRHDELPRSGGGSAQAVGEIVLLASMVAAAHVPGLETSVSLLVMNSSSTGMPSLVFAMPRRIAGMMSSGFVTRSPWPPKARAMAA